MNANEFMRKVAEDEAFRNQIGANSDMTLEEFQGKAAAAGYNFSEADLMGAIGQVGSAALTDEELDSVAGGADKVKVSGTLTVKGGGGTGGSVTIGNN